MLKRTTENFLEAQDLEERGSQSLLCTAPPPPKKGSGQWGGQEGEQEREDLLPEHWVRVTEGKR